MVCHRGKKLRNEDVDNLDRELRGRVRVVCSFTIPKDLIFFLLEFIAVNVMYLLL